MDDTILEIIHSYNFEVSNNSNNSIAEEWIMPSNQTFADTLFSEIVPNDGQSHQITQSPSDFDGFESNNFQTMQSVPDFDGFQPQFSSTNNLSRALASVGHLADTNDITEPRWFEPQHHRPTEEPIADTTQHADISLGDIGITWTIGDTNRRKDLLQTVLYILRFH